MDNRLNFLELKIPPPVVALLCGGAMWYLASRTPSLGLPATALWTTTAVLVALAIFIMLAGVIAFLLARTTLDPHKPASARVLVTGGIYRCTRNPMYLGLLLLLLAWAVYLASPEALVGVLVFWLYIGRFQIQPEERVLDRLFGDVYTQYRSRVRRWL